MSETNLASDFIARAILGIADEKRSAYKVLGEMESCLHIEWSQKKVFEEQLKGALEYNLASLGRRLPVLLDLLGMKDTRSSFLEQWKNLSSGLGETTLHVDQDYGPFLLSEPLELLDDIIRVLAFGASDATVEERRLAANLDTLEFVLRSTPRILKARGIVPTREHDIQVELDLHLEHTFPDYSKSVKLPKGLKSFIPDGAIPSLRALIEVKFADSHEKVKRALSGIKEDLSGYGGTRDWTRFYSLLYQTEAFTVENRFNRSLKLSGNAASWKAIVVTGAGAQRQRTDTKPSGSRA